MTNEATLKALAMALHESARLNHNIGEGLQRAICQSVESHARRARAILEAEPRLVLRDPPVKPNPDFYRDIFESMEADPDEVREMADGELSVIHHPEHTPGCKDGECRACEGPLEHLPQAEHHPCPGDADGEWEHCACHCPSQAKRDGEALKDEVSRLAHLTPEQWQERRGGDPIARTINAVLDIIDAAALGGPTDD